MILGTGSVLSVGLLVAFMYGSLHPSLTLERKAISHCESQILSIPFVLQEGSIHMPEPNLEGEIGFSFERSRPDSETSLSTAYTLRLKKSGQTQRIFIPTQIGLKYENELEFSDEESSFWMDLKENGTQQISVHVFVCNLAGVVEEVGSFFVPVEESPVRLPGEFADNPAFKTLSESRLLGKDLFVSKYGEEDLSQRIEIGFAKGAEQIFVKAGDYLAWEDNKWKKTGSFSDGNGLPIARVAFFDDKILLFEAWDLAEYMRLSVSSSPPLPLKTNGEEFLTAVRVRSEKQISCMLDKQCFVLRAGDWILKEVNRWRILRKVQEKDAYMQGKLVGELFVFDRIDLKGGQKTLQGSLFNQERSQIFLVEVGANAQGKNGIVKDMSVSRKGKGK